MQEISIYLAAHTLIYIWVMFFNKEFNGKEIVYKHRLAHYIDFKPINCKLCLSFWIGIILAICLGNILFVSLPLYHLIKNDEL